MRESVHVRAIQALRDLDAALARFAYGARAALEIVQTETRRTQDSLEQRHHHLQREVDRNRRAAHDPGAAADSWRRLPASEGALADVRRWLTEVRGAVDGYRFHASRLRSLIAVEIPRARSLLHEKIAALERYLAVTPEAPSRASGTLGSVAPCGETLASGPAQLVAGLKQSGPSGDFDLQLFLKTNIPGAHLVQLEVVEYADATELLPEDALVGALTCLPQRKVTLSIYFQNPNTAQDEHMLRQAVAHEVGHNVHSNVLDDEARSLWEEVSARRGSAGRVSEYAGEDASEDFAESYAFFLTDPDALRDVSPEKHRFRLEEAFETRIEGLDPDDREALENQYREMFGEWCGEHLLELIRQEEELILVKLALHQNLHYSEYIENVLTTLKHDEALHPYLAALLISSSVSRFGLHLSLNVVEQPNSNQSLPRNKRVPCQKSIYEGFSDRGFQVVQDSPRERQPT